MTVRDGYRTSHVEKGATYDAALEHDVFAPYMDDREARLLRRIIPALFPAGVPRYLDFACGTGRIARVIERFASESFGIDVAESMIEEARHKCLPMTFIVADITTGAAPIAPVSLVTAFRFFGNAEDPLRVAALRAIAGLVTPGGYLIVNNHRNPYTPHDFLLHIRGGHSRLDLTWWKMRRLLKAAGFHVVRSYPVAAWLLRYRWLKRLSAGSGSGDLLEKLFGSRVLSPFAPDMIIVAQKS